MIRLPWISRAAHSEVVTLLKEECAELKSERRVLLNRLAALGSGSPLFGETTEDEDSNSASEESLISGDQLLLEQLARLKHRPAKLADMLTRQYKDFARSSKPTVAWIPAHLDRVRAALNQAEEAGRDAASAAEQSHSSASGERSR